MRSLSVAQANAHLSQLLLQAVEAGEEVEITRRGVPVAGLTPVEPQRSRGFDLAGFLAATEAQPLPAGDQLLVGRHEGPVSGHSSMVSSMTSLERMLLGTHRVVVGWGAVAITGRLA